MKTTLRTWTNIASLLAVCGVTAAVAWRVTAQELRQVANPPSFGTFYLLTQETSAIDSPPYPFDPYGGLLPVYQIAGFPNSYLVADSPEDYSVMQSATRASLAMSSMGADGPQMSQRVFGTNDLWLEITSWTNSTANLTIHPPWNVTNGVWGLYFKPNLAVPYKTGRGWCGMRRAKRIY
jgi:hypothetical protein